MATISGGNKLDEALQEIAARLSKAREVQVGFLPGGTEPNGASTPMVAAIHEYGAPRANIPPRPFFRPMIRDKSREWGPAIAAILPTVDYDAQKTLEQVGGAIAGQLRDSIIAVMTPPLSPVTLMLRKMFGNHPEGIRGRDVAEARRRVAAGESVGGVSTKPLVWTGTMLMGVDYVVK